MSCTEKSPRKITARALARRDALVLEHLEWALEIARKVARRLPTWFVEEDLAGPAQMGLLMAASRYDAGSGVPFRAYAHARVHGACIDSIRRREYQERAMASIDAELPEQERPHDVRDMAPNPEDLAGAGELRLVWERVKKLPNRERALLHRIYGQGMTIAEVERQPLVKNTRPLGKSRLAKIHQGALRALRPLCEDLRKAA